MFTAIYTNGIRSKIRGVDIEIRRDYGKYYCPTAGRIMLAAAIENRNDKSKYYLDTPHGRFTVCEDDKTIMDLVSAGF